jgi:small subunit ribosomal protein S5
MYQTDQKTSEFSEKVVQIKRVTKVVKGGKKMSFRALVVVGDRAGRVGIGIGKANVVPNAVQKATYCAKKNMVNISLSGSTIPFEAIGNFGSSSVFLRPARVGRGVIAGGSVRIVLESAGIKDIVAKTHGSTNAINSAKAAINALVLIKKKENLVSSNEVKNAVI